MTVSQMMKVTVWALQEISVGEGTVEEVGLQAFPKNSQWRRQRDILQLSVLRLGRSEKMSSIADG